MLTISGDKSVEKAKDLNSLTEVNEREFLSATAAGVPEGGLIVEIGALYGGTTGVLALAAPKAKVISIDTFEWHPEGYPEASSKLLLENMAKIGAKNVEVIAADSREIGKTWSQPIDMIFIDGGHSYEYVYPDLCNFAPHAKLVLLHDYGNPFWTSVMQAVVKFMSENPGWMIMAVVGTVCCLVRRKDFSVGVA